MQDRLHKQTFSDILQCTESMSTHVQSMCSKDWTNKPSVNTAHISWIQWTESTRTHVHRASDKLDKQTFPVAQLTDLLNTVDNQNCLRGCQCELVVDNVVMLISQLQCCCNFDALYSWFVANDSFCRNTYCPRCSSHRFLEIYFHLLLPVSYLIFPTILNILNHWCLCWEI